MLLPTYDCRDHRGVSNVQLAIEDIALRDRYKNKSVAEQHSLDLSWEILMRDQVRACIAL
jgi:hypothetical protein